MSCHICNVGCVFFLFCLASLLVEYHIMDHKNITFGGLILHIIPLFPFLSHCPYLY